MILMTCSVIIIFSIQNVQAMPNLSPQDLYKASDMVFYGQVISKQAGSGSDYYYQIKVQTFFKNPQMSDSITVAGHKPSEGHVAYPQFEIGDKAIFYIEKQEGINVISPYSTKAGEGCDIHAFLGPAPIPGEPIVRGPPSPLDLATDVNVTTHGPFTVNQSVLITYHVWNNFPQSRNVTVELTATNQNDTTIHFYKKQSVGVDACDSNAVNWTFVPTKSGTYIVNATENTTFRAGESFEVVGSDLSVTVNSTHVISPLKQFKSGIGALDVTCKTGLQLVIKSEDHSPACVTPEHVTRLIQNGWTVSNPFNRIADTDILSAKTYNLKQIHYYDSSNLNPKVSLYDYSYDGIDKDGLVTIGNQTFYQTTLDNDIYKLKGISKQFHNIVFSFPEGTLTTPGGAFVNLYVKFQDGFEEIYGGTTSNPDGSGSVGGISIPTQYGPHLAVSSITVLGNHTLPQAGLTIYHNKVKLLVSDDNQTSLQTTPVSLGECDVPYELRSGFVPILYMPTNSIGKVCVDYFNGNEPTTVTPRVFGAQNLSQDTGDISVSPLQANIVHGNSTVVYTITSGNKAGFYGLTIFCAGTPIAVGYDNQSRIVTGDFPWLNHTYYCILRSYDYHIVGVGGGMGIKYVPP